MSVAAYLGIAAAIMAAGIAVQTMRLRSAKQALEAERQRSADATAIAEEGAKRNQAELDALTKERAELESIRRTEDKRLAKLAAEKIAARKAAREVENAGDRGDAGAILDAIGDVLDGETAAVPEAGDQGGADGRV